MLKLKIKVQVAAAITLLASVAVIQSANAAGKIRVRAAYVPAVTWLSAWVAKDEGFFARQGLDVSLRVVQNISMVPPTLGKQLDVGPATVVDLINAAGHGLNVVAISGNHSDVPGAVTNTVVVRKGSGIKNIKDLAGKTVATPTVGAILHIALLYWLKKEGVDINSIRAVEVPFPNMPDQMKAGRIDAAEAVQPFASQMIAAGNRALGDQLLKVASPALSTVWIANRTWAEKHKNIVAKWSAALLEAKAFIKKNPEKARGILAKYTRLPAKVVQSIPLPDFTIKIQPKQIDVWIKVLADLGKLQKPLKGANLMIMAE